MTTTHVALARAKARIRRKAEEMKRLADEAAAVDNIEEAIALRAVFDGLEEALSIIEEEESS